VFLVLAGGLVAWGLSTLPAAGQADVYAQEAQAPGSADAAGNPQVAMPAQDVAAIRPAQSMTYTVYLPYVRSVGFPIGPVGESPFGIQIYQVDETHLNRLDGMGARWIRIPFSWRYVEPENTTPENYRWSTILDQQLASLSAANVNVILTFSFNPDWAATYINGPVDKAPLSELAEFMGAAVARYSQAPYNVKHWEFYNEPDNGSLDLALKAWGYFGHTPELYAAELAAVYGPMKAADPETQLVFGGISYDNWEVDGGVFVKDFVDKVLQYGGGAHFDVMNFHYYPVFHTHWDPYGPDIIGKVTYMRDLLASYGVTKPFLCTETSMWSDAAHGGSDELQSRYVHQVFARSRAADLQTTIWFKLVDDEWDGIAKYGLLHPDLSLKPGYYAYQTMNQQLGGTEYMRSLGSGETGSDDIEAYAFQSGDGTTEIVVAWTMDDSSLPMKVVANCVDIVDKYGTMSSRCDSQDGVVDGRVTVTIGPSPVYLRYPAATR